MKYSYPKSAVVNSFGKNICVVSIVTYGCSVVVDPNFFGRTNRKSGIGHPGEISSI